MWRFVHKKRAVIARDSPFLFPEGKIAYSSSCVSTIGAGAGAGAA
jgi:hypothetical protein